MIAEALDNSDVCPTEEEFRTALKQSDARVLALLQRVCAEAESWHSVHDNESPGGTLCDSICALIPEMREMIATLAG